MRQIILDTETTGLEPAEGHRVIEIGCVELVDRRLSHNHYHQYLNPEREIEDGALEVHGISNEFLLDKPTFAEVADDFLDFVRGAELIIHNAPFDIGFLDNELALLGRDDRMADHVTVLDTLELARDLHPGQRNSLDALCKRYEVDNSSRTLHGALLDSEILADVYLAMTGGQSDLGLSFQAADTAEVDLAHL
ncbi:MAG: DNA polymerase III subunit epsilon, partial [Xanthomonadales bacterium]